MSLFDLWRLIKHYWYIVAAVLVACVLTGSILFTMQSIAADKLYTAKSVIVVNSGANTVLGLAKSNADSVTLDNPEIRVITQLSSGTTNIVITATGKDAILVESVAGEIAEAAVDQAHALFDASQRGNSETKFEAMIVDTAVTEAADEGQSSGSIARNVIVAILAGLSFGISIVVAIYARRRPVISAEGIQEMTELPVLECLPLNDDGSRLLANIRFASGQNKLETVCLLPVGEEDPCSQIKKVLESAFEANKEDGTRLEVSAYAPLFNTMEGAYASQKAQATVLIVTQWKDSCRQLENAVAELQLAQAKLVGLVFVTSKRVGS